MGDLIPNDVWSNHIFTRLESRTVLCCKCVCKGWHDLLSISTAKNWKLNYYIDFKVCSSYSDTSKSNCTCITAAPKVNLDIVSIIGSSNGYLCCTCTVNDSNNPKQLAICNVSNLGDYKLIPFALGSSSSGYIGFYHDFVSGFSTAVCFEPVRPDFNNNNKVRVYIYSTKTSSWETKECRAPFNLCTKKLMSDTHRPKTCGTNGCIYWMTTDSNNVLVFKLKDSKLREVNMPSDWCYNAGYESSDLSVICGTLRLSQNVQDLNTKRFSMWTLECGRWYSTWYNGLMNIKTLKHLRPVGTFEQEFGRRYVVSLHATT